MPTMTEQTMVAYEPVAGPSKFPAMGSFGYEPTTAFNSDPQSSPLDPESLHSLVPEPSFAPRGTGTDGQEDGCQTPSSLDGSLFRFNLENDNQMMSDNLASLDVMLSKLESATVRKDGVGPHSNEEFKRVQSVFESTRAAMSALAKWHVKRTRNPYGILEQDLSAPPGDDDSSSTDIDHVQERIDLSITGREPPQRVSASPPPSSRPRRRPRRKTEMMTAMLAVFDEIEAANGEKDKQQLKSMLTDGASDGSGPLTFKSLSHLVSGHNGQHAADPQQIEKARGLLVWTSPALDESPTQASVALSSHKFESPSFEPPEGSPLNITPLLGASTVASIDVEASAMDVDETINIEKQQVGNKGASSPSRRTGNVHSPSRPPVPVPPPRQSAGEASIEEDLDVSESKGPQQAVHSKLGLATSGRSPSPTAASAESPKRAASRRNKKSPASNPAAPSPLPWSCAECGKTFNTKSQRDGHTAVHAIKRLQEARAESAASLTASIDAPLKLTHEAERAQSEASDDVPLARAQSQSQAQAAALLASVAAKSQDYDSDIDEEPLAKRRRTSRAPSKGVAKPASPPLPPPSPPPRMSSSATAPVPAQTKDSPQEPVVKDSPQGPMAKDPPQQLMTKDPPNDSKALPQRASATTAVAQSIERIRSDATVKANAPSLNFGKFKMTLYKMGSDENIKRHAIKTGKEISQLLNEANQSKLFDNDSARSSLLEYLYRRLKDKESDDSYDFVKALLEKETSELWIHWLNDLTSPSGNKRNHTGKGGDKWKTTQNWFEKLLPKLSGRAVGKLGKACSDLISARTGSNEFRKFLTELVNKWNGDVSKPLPSAAKIAGKEGGSGAKLWSAKVGNKAIPLKAAAGNASDAPKAALASNAASTAASHSTPSSQLRPNAPPVTARSLPPPISTSRPINAMRNPRTTPTFSPTSVFPGTSSSTTSMKAPASGKPGAASAQRAFQAPGPRSQDLRDNISWLYAAPKPQSPTTPTTSARTRRLRFAEGVDLVQVREIETFVKDDYDEWHQQAQWGNGNPTDKDEGDSFRKTIITVDNALIVAEELAKEVAGFALEDISVVEIEGGVDPPLPPQNFGDVPHYYGPPPQVGQPLHVGPPPQFGHPLHFGPLPQFGPSPLPEQSLPDYATYMRQFLQSTGAYPDWPGQQR